MYDLLGIAILVCAVPSLSVAGKVWIRTPDNGNLSAFNDPTVYNLYTSLHRYELDSHRNFNYEFHFKVSSFGGVCAASFVLLSAAQDLQSDQFYEIYLGATSIIIRKGYQTDVLVNSFSAVTQCGTNREFSIRWTCEGHLNVKSDVGEVLADWTDPNPFEVYGIGVKTGYGNEGIWQVPFTDYFSGYFCCKPDTYGQMNVFETVKSHSKISCARECFNYSDCLGFNYNVHTNVCKLISFGEIVKTNDLDGWDFATKCMDGKKACLGCLNA